MDREGHVRAPRARAVVLVPRARPPDPRCGTRRAGPDLGRPPRGPRYLALALSKDQADQFRSECEVAGGQRVPPLEDPNEVTSWASSSCSRPGWVASAPGIIDRLDAPPTASWWSSTTRRGQHRHPPSNTPSSSESTSTPCSARSPRTPLRSSQTAPPERAHHPSSPRRRKNRPAAPRTRAVEATLARSGSAHSAGLPGRRTSVPDSPLCASADSRPFLARPSGGNPAQAAVTLGATVGRCGYDRLRSRAESARRPDVPTASDTGPRANRRGARWCQLRSMIWVDAWFEPPAGQTAPRRHGQVGDRPRVTTESCGRRPLVCGARHPAPGTRPCRAGLGIAGVESTIVNRTLKRRGGPKSADPDGLELSAAGRSRSAFHLEQLPQRPHPGCLLRRHRHEPAGGPGWQRPPVHRGHTCGCQPLHLRAHHGFDVIGGAAIATAIDHAHVASREPGLPDSLLGCHGQPFP